MQEVELTQTVDAFKCTYCNMVSLTKSSVVRHEKKFCRKSPVRKACVLCKNFIWTEFEISEPYCVKRDEPIEEDYTKNCECSDFETKIVRVDPILTEFCTKYKNI